MSENHPLEWPLPPSQAASVAHQLCMALADLARDEAGGGGMSRRAYLKFCGLATAAEVFARDAARWYGSLKGEDEAALEQLEERYQASRKSKGEGRK